MPKKNQPCYFCGEPSNGLEHIPAKQFFVGFQVDSITVPSCNIHNGSKSHHDEAIVKALLMSLASIAPTYKLHTDVISAINFAKEKFSQVRALVRMRSLVEGDSLAALRRELAWVRDQTSIHQWMIQLTAGWVWNALKKFDRNNAWKNAKAYSFDYMQQGEDESFTREEATEKIIESHEKRTRILAEPWVRGWSSHPNRYPESIYQFSIQLREKELIFHHRFYNGSYNWFVEFEPSNETREKFLAIIKRAK